MKDLGLLHYFLGLEIWQRSGGLFVFQGKYAREILEKFNMHGCKPVDTPLPGGWRKEDATSGEEVDALVYRQLVGSLIQEDEVKLCGFTDADWAGSPTDRKRTSGGVFNIGSTAVSWYSRKQRSVALSSAEARSNVGSSFGWMRGYMDEEDPELFVLFHLILPVIYCDNAELH
eukprot:PITA_26564